MWGSNRNAMKKLISILGCILLVMLIISCTTKAGKPGEEGTDEKVLKFKKFSYIDQQGAGMEAFSFLMPSDWKFEGGMEWILDNPAMPANTSFRVYNPVGQEAFEVFTNHCYFWTSNSQLLGMFPPGSKYYGSVVKQPVNARTALKNILLQEHRGNMKDLKITKEEDLPDLAKALTVGHVGEATGARMRITYTIDTTRMEEEFYAVVEQITFPIQGMFGVSYNTIWFVDYIFSFRGEEGKLDGNTKLFETMTTSFRVNPKWQAKYDHLIEYMAQQEIRHIQSVGEFSRMLSRMSDQMSTESLQRYEAQSSVYDQVSENFSDHTRGVEKFYDPFEERQIDLPSGFGQAWCNNLGEYIVTDNPNYNPNVGSNLTWKPMEAK